MDLKTKTNDDFIIDSIYNLIANKINWDELKNLRTYYEEKFANLLNKKELEVSSIKYVIHTEDHIKIAIRNVLLLGLDLVKPINILDLGAGAGYFLFICKQLGHYGLGLDINPEETYKKSPNYENIKEILPFYRDLFKCLGLEKIESNINTFTPLPDFGRKFDLITAFYICFNNHKRTDLWSVEEWDFFLTDLSQYLTDDGSVFLRFNCEENGEYYSDQLLKFFLTKGRKVSDSEILIHADKL